jgi:uncharacterized protein YqeY
MSSIKLRIQEDLKVALKSQDKKTLGVLRFISAAIKQYEVDKRIAADDDAVIKIFGNLSKQRNESIVQFQKANRTDLVEQEQFELEILKKYLPAPLSEKEVSLIIEQTMKEFGATDIKELGKILSSISKKIAGRADMSKISAIVRSKLQSSN